jgi:hypothetical protein
MPTTYPRHLFFSTKQDRKTRPNSQAPMIQARNTTLLIGMPTKGRNRKILILVKTYSPDQGRNGSLREDPSALLVASMVRFALERQAYCDLDALGDSLSVMQMYMYIESSEGHNFYIGGGRSLYWPSIQMIHRNAVTISTVNSIMVLIHT